MSFKFKDVYATGYLIVQNATHWRNIRATLHKMGYTKYSTKEHIKLFPSAVFLSCLGFYHTGYDLKSALERGVHPRTIREIMLENNELHSENYVIVICKPNMYTRAVRAVIGAMEYVADKFYEVYQFLRGK